MISPFLYGGKPGWALNLQEVDWEKIHVTDSFQTKRDLNTTEIHQKWQKKAMENLV